MEPKHSRREPNYACDSGSATYPAHWKYEISTGGEKACPPHTLLSAVLHTRRAVLVALLYNSIHTVVCMWYNSRDDE